ncbi:hypothetical protein BH11BAC2_BH11BAC2_02700 [soil metagenome]
MIRHLLILLICFPLWINAQTKAKAPKILPYTSDEVKEAKSEGALYFKDMNYLQALKIYERLVVTDPNDAEYNFKLGMCYLNTNINKGKSVAYLEYAANSNAKERPKDVLFELGKAYHYAGLFDQALETFEKFRVEKKGSVDAKLKFDSWVSWSNNAKTLTSTPVPCTFENMGKSINTPSPDYRPLVGAADTIIYFSSKRKGNAGGLTDDFGDIPSDIYFFIQTDTARSKAKSVGTTVNTAFYEEGLFLSMNGDKMLIYREGPEANGDIYISQLQGKQWSAPVILGKDFETKALETGATLSPDGLTLFFAAESLDGKTGKDIYRCTRSESTSWSKPERLGDNINTKGDEDAPYLWLDGKTFFFSSTGHNSMGGYDVFKAIMNDPREGLGTAENLGYPINSVYDNMGVAVLADGKTFYTAAVRDSGLGDYDIYKVTCEKVITASALTWLEARAFTNVGSAAKGADVIITDATSGATVANLTTNDASGRFDAALPKGTYKVVLRHAKYGKTEAEITVDPDTMYKTVLELIFP